MATASHLLLASPLLRELFELEPQNKHLVRLKACCSSVFQYSPTRILSLKLRCTGRGVDVLGADNEKGMQSLEMRNGSSVDANFSNDFERQLDEFFVEIRRMLESGERDAAVDLLLANYEAVKEQIDVGIKGIEQAATLDVVALGYMAMGEVKFVGHLLDMLMEIVGDLKDDSRLLDSVLIHMGSMYTTLGMFNEATLVYNRALGILEHLFGKKSPFLVLPLLGKAKVLTLMGKFTNAKVAYEDAVTILEIHRGNESEELVPPLFALGNLHIDEGNGIDAEFYFKRILSIHKKAHGDADGRVGVARCFLARALCAKGNIHEAVKEYEKGLRIIEDSRYMTVDDDVLQKIRVDLAELLHAAGRVQEGRELLEESLLIAEQSKGSGHPSLVTHLLNLATSYSHSKNYVEAERLLKYVLQIMSKKMDPVGQDITKPMLQLAVILYKLGRDKEAESLAIQALQRREEAFGKHSLPVGEALDCLTSIQTRLGKDDSMLLEQLKRVLEIQERELGFDNEGTMDTMKKIIFFLDKMGRRDEKSPIERRLSMLRRKHMEKIAI